MLFYRVQGTYGFIFYFFFETIFETKIHYELPKPMAVSYVWKRYVYHRLDLNSFYNIAWVSPTDFRFRFDILKMMNV